MALTKVTYSMIVGAAANVTDYGADPTGAASSVTAITNAIASLSADGGTLFFPAGTYALPSVVAITKSNLKIVGEPGAIIEITGANIHNAFQFTACTNVVISGLRFEWNGATVYQESGAYENNYALRFKPDAVSFASCNNIVIENCYFYECANSLFERVSGAQETAVGLDANKRYYNVKILNNTHYGTVTCDTNYIDATFLSSYEIAGNIFTSDANSFAIARVIGSGAVGGGNRYSSDGIIRDNEVSNKRYVFYVGAATNILVHNNILNQNGGTDEGIDFENCQKCMADANKIYATGKPFAIFYSFADIVISNNDVQLNEDAAYFLQHGASQFPTGNLTIRNNTVYHLSPALNTAQLQANCTTGNLVCDNNQFDCVQLVFTGSVYTQSIRGNEFVMRHSGDNVILTADCTGITAGITEISDNRFIGTNTGSYLAANVIVSQVVSASVFKVERNYFAKFQSAFVHQGVTAAPNVKHIYRDNIIGNNMQEAYTPSGGGAGESNNLVFEKLMDDSGLDWFGTNSVPSYGCGRGSTIWRDPPASGQVWAWVNTSNTGTPTWTAIATLP